MEAGLRAEFSPSSGGSTCWNISRLYKKRLLTGWTSSKESLMVRQRVSGGWIYVLQFFMLYFSCDLYYGNVLYTLKIINQNSTYFSAWKLAGLHGWVGASRAIGPSAWTQAKHQTAAEWTGKGAADRSDLCHMRAPGHISTIITGLPRINTFLYRATKPKSLKNNRLRTMWNWTNCSLQSRWFWLWTWN